MHKHKNMNAVLLHTLLHIRTQLVHFTTRMNYSKIIQKYMGSEWEMYLPEECSTMLLFDWPTWEVLGEHIAEAARILLLETEKYLRNSWWRLEDSCLTTDLYFTCLAQTLQVYIWTVFNSQMANGLKTKNVIKGFYINNIK